MQNITIYNLVLFWAHPFLCTYNFAKNYANTYIVLKCAERKLRWRHQDCTSQSNLTQLSFSRLIVIITEQCFFGVLPVRPRFYLGKFRILFLYNFLQNIYLLLYIPTTQRNKNKHVIIFSFKFWQQYCFPVMMSWLYSISSGVLSYQCTHWYQSRIFRSHEVRSLPWIFFRSISVIL